MTDPKRPEDADELQPDEAEAAEEVAEEEAAEEQAAEEFEDFDDEPAETTKPAASKAKAATVQVVDELPHVDDRVSKVFVGLMVATFLLILAYGFLFGERGGIFSPTPVPEPTEPPSPSFIVTPRPSPTVAPSVTVAPSGTPGSSTAPSSPTARPSASPAASST